MISSLSSRISCSIILFCSVTVTELFSLFCRILWIFSIISRISCSVSLKILTTFLRMAKSLHSLWSSTIQIPQQGHPCSLQYDCNLSLCWLQNSLISKTNNGNFWYSEIGVVVSGGVRYTMMPCAIYTESLITFRTPNFWWLRNVADITYTTGRWSTRHNVDILKYIVCTQIQI